MRVLTDPAIALQTATEVGGKAANLAQLELLGLPVPSWLAISTHAFSEAVSGLAPRIAARLGTVAPGAAAPSGDLAAAAAEIRAWIVAAPLPPGLAEEIARAFAERIGAAALVAVRSSAAGEDAVGESFAGLHDSFLFVRGLDAVLAAVRRVWASAYNERALAYRLARSLRARKVEKNS